MASKNEIDMSFRQNWYCKISIDDNELIPKNIVSCSIREWVFDFLPRIELQIQDDGALTEAFPIKDDSVLSIVLGVDPDDENMIEADFDIVDKTIDVIAGNKQTLISLSGLLKTNNFFWPIKSRSFSNKTSVDVVQTIANEIGLKFVKGDNLNTSDLMSWLQLNINDYDFLRHILQRLYVPNSTGFIYGTVQNELIMTSLKNEIEKGQSIQAKYSVKNFTNYKIIDEQDKNTIWYKDYNFVNYTNQMNRLAAYGLQGNYYNFVGNQTVNISDNSTTLSESSYKAHSGENVRNDMFGILNNVYDEYFQARLQNEFWKKSFFGISVLVGINPVYPVRLFDKIEFNVESLTSEERNEVQSGEYLVAGITHNVAKKSNYRKIISLHRNGDNEPNI